MDFTFAGLRLHTLPNIIEKRGGPALAWHSLAPGEREEVEVREPSDRIDTARIAQRVHRGHYNTAVVSILPFLQSQKKEEKPNSAQFCMHANGSKIG